MEKTAGIDGTKNSILQTSKIYSGVDQFKKKALNFSNAVALDYELLTDKTLNEYN